MGLSSGDTRLLEAFISSFFRTDILEDYSLYGRLNSGLTHSRQPFCHWAVSPSPTISFHYSLSKFPIVALNSLALLPRQGSLASASKVAGSTITSCIGKKSFSAYQKFFLFLYMQNFKGLIKSCLDGLQKRQDAYSFSSSWNKITFI